MKKIYQNLSKASKIIIVICLLGDVFAPRMALGLALDGSPPPIGKKNCVILGTIVDNILTQTPSQLCVARAPKPPRYYYYKEGTTEGYVNSACIESNLATGACRAILCEFAVCEL